MGPLDYYRQFEAMTEEEVNVIKRAEAAERRAKALSRVDPLDLARTTWPEYPSAVVVNAITIAARRGLHRYLDRHSAELRSELAHRHDVPVARLVVGDGSAQLLSSAATALLEDGDELVTPWPSYPLYPLMARAARGHAVPVPGFSVGGILAAINDRTRIVVLCNPNDPTGELLTTAQLRELLGALPERVVVLLDEALRDYVDAEPTDAALALLDEFPRLLVFRTFSKAWGLAGLRVGYALGGPGADPLLERLAPELGVNELAQAGALEALRTTRTVAAQRGEEISALRAKLASGLDALDCSVTPSQANFLWVGAPGLGGGELAARMERLGVVVAGGGPLGDPERVRITVPHRVELVERTLRAAELALAGQR
jgi:histidinol-phosphate aminotransferase